MSTEKNSLTIRAPYQGARIAFATMHQKERALAPLFKSYCKAELFVPAHLDTDAFGTFSGDIPRRGTMGEVALAKARLGMKQTGLPYGLASEGSFGPHPLFPIGKAGLELLAFVDDVRGITIFESFIDDSPCFEHCEVSSLDEAEPFLERVRFPQTALMVSPHARAQGSELFKAIWTKSELIGAFERSILLSETGSVIIRTDMRAHCNPRRMEAIAKAGQKLVQKLTSICDACGSPGFGVTKPAPGLPCQWCSEPTSLPSGRILACVHCAHVQYEPRTDGLSTAEPRYCYSCNP